MKFLAKKFANFLARQYAKKSMAQTHHLIPTTALSEDTSPIAEEDTEDYTVETT